MSGNDGRAGLVVLAVDDEKHGLSELEYVLKSDPRIGTVLTASDADEALPIVRGGGRCNGDHQQPRVEVVFLDILMPGLDGLELAKMLAMLPDPPVVVFVTANDRAIEAFDIGAVDYLTKPINGERLANTMRRIMHARRQAAPSDTGAAGEGPTGDEEVIPVELAGTTKLVPRSSVRWVEAQGDYARLHTPGAVTWCASRSPSWRTGGPTPASCASTGPSWWRCRWSPSCGCAHRAMWYGSAPAPTSSSCR